MERPIVVNKRTNAREVYRMGQPIRKDGNREEVIQRYRTWITERPELIVRLRALNPTHLVCWCAPLACHADVPTRGDRVMALTPDEERWFIININMLAYNTSDVVFDWPTVNTHNCGCISVALWGRYLYLQDCHDGIVMGTEWTRIEQ